MKESKKGQFWYIVKDYDTKRFSIHGPLIDDNAWNKKVCDAQDAGRDVRSETVPATQGKEALANQVEQQLKLIYSPNSILEEPEDTTNLYEGKLPGYAKNANRKRVVRILCKGECKATRWAEMSVDYPGKEVLSNAELFDFTAKCLKCGYQAKDPYDWLR